VAGGGHEEGGGGGKEGELEEFDRAVFESDGFPTGQPGREEDENRPEADEGRVEEGPVPTGGRCGLV